MVDSLPNQRISNIDFRGHAIDTSNLFYLYLGSAAGGGGIFIIQTLLSFMGVDGIGDGDGDMDFDGGDFDGGDSHHAFSFFSLHNLTAFFMMFGLSGMAYMPLLEGFAWLSIVGATLTGIIAVRIIFMITKGMYALQSSGTLNNEDATGSKGTVYLHIKPDEPGKVQISLQNRFRIMNAVSGDGADLAEGTRVRVTGVSDGTTLVVVQDTE